MCKDLCAALGSFEHIKSSSVARLLIILFVVAVFGTFAVISNQQCMRVLCPYSLPALDICFLDDSHCDWDELEHQSSFNLYSPMAKNGEPLFKYVLAICISSFENCLHFSPFIDWMILVLLCLIFGVLHRLNINRFSEI